MSAWSAAGPRSLAAIRGFLERREWSCCSLSSRVSAAGKVSPIPPRGGSFLVHASGAGEDSADGLFLVDGAGCLYPALGDSPRESDRELVALADIGARRLSACMGLSSDVARIEGAAGIASLAGGDYHLMALGPGEALRRENPPFAGLEAVRPGKGDLPSILPLQLAYEKEEVLAPIHAADARATKAGLSASLSSQAMLLARYRGRFIAKAQTNARGMSWDQLGGIYVEPGFRARGLGGWLVSALCAALAAEGRGLTLFVKKANAPAIAVYRRLGFAFRESYRISYYS